MEDILKMIQDFRIRKAWDKTDTPHNLAKSTLIESAELLECFMTENLDEEALKNELADVLMYALSLAIDLNYDIYDIIQHKLVDVDQRYPDHHD